MSRSRDRILKNLEDVYRDAFDRAKESGDRVRMLDLDAAFQREQLMLEVLLDIRDALAGSDSVTRGTLEKLQALRTLTTRRG
ncbi:MAG: hypothetical protein A2W29_08530 [Gemmatimonadetes bacterium RBG_16_66_8]|nr:MAG: hypothetical protein A2W29_08530 [Gemmatimonadetes bacterium RBG_16_66_8]